MLARMLLNDSPLSQMTRQMADEMDRVFTHPGSALAGALGVGAPVPALNMWRDERTISLEAELPGYRLEDIEILAQDQTVTIRGHRSIALPEGATTLRCERRTGAFERTITLPVPFDVAGVSATLRDGVLSVTLPLPPEVQPRRVMIRA